MPPTLPRAPSLLPTNGQPHQPHSADEETVGEGGNILQPHPTRRWLSRDLNPHLPHAEAHDLAAVLYCGPFYLGEQWFHLVVLWGLSFPWGFLWGWEHCRHLAIKAMTDFHNAEAQTVESGHSVLPLSSCVIDLTSHGCALYHLNCPLSSLCSISSFTTQLQLRHFMIIFSGKKVKVLKK